ncbi:MAG: DUF6249 domain-containing protein [Dysgonamonadaceae bacterium]|jgi:hypothetical protein|nr:DUF6249 domain-containing protein [Dysgonamonadaceae bacterium]
MEYYEFITAILAIGGPIVLIIVIVSLQCDVKKTRYKMQADIYTKAIDKGQEIPRALPDLFETEPIKRVVSEGKKFHDGIVLITIGIGIILFSLFAFWNNEFVRFALGCGIIPIVVGGGKLLTYYLYKRRTSIEDSKTTDLQ